jgi:membrane protease YdiL (CAAX protease family)
VTAALAVVTVAVMSFRLLGTSAPYEPSVGEFLLVPVGEELLFRGLLLGFLLGTFARAEVPHTAAWAVVASAMAFGVGHLGNLGYVDSRFVVLQVFVAAAFGVLAGWLRIRTDSIAGPVLLHMVMNTLAVAG